MPATKFHTDLPLIAIFVEDESTLGRNQARCNITTANLGEAVIQDMMSTAKAMVKNGHARTASVQGYDVNTGQRDMLFLYDGEPSDWEYDHWEEADLIDQIAEAACWQSQYEGQRAVDLS